MAKIKNMGHGTGRFKEGLIISGSAHQPDGSDSNYSLINSGSLYNEGPLLVQGNLDGAYVATIDNDQNTNGHVLKLLTDGNGVHSRLLEMEDGDGDVIFRARADGRFGFGPDGVSSMGAGTFVVGIDNSSHTSDIAISRRLQHLGDSNTYLDFPSADTFNLVAGGNSFLKYDGNILINNANADVDTKIMADDGNVVLHVDAGTNRVGIGTTSPAETLDVNGVAKATSIQTGLLEYTDGDDAITIEDGGYLKLHSGIRYARGVLVSSTDSPAQVGGWIKFATLDVPGTSNLDTAASSFLVTFAGMESSNNRAIDGIFMVHAKFTVNTDGSADSSSNYYESEGTKIYCEALNADKLAATGATDFDPATDLIMITTNTDSTPVVDLYIKANAKDKHCFVTHLGGTGQTGTFDTDAGWTINTGQSWVTTEPAAPTGSAKITGTWVSKVFSKLTVEERTENRGAVFNNVKVITSFPYTVADDDYIIIVEGSGTRTINLPAKADQLGRTLIIKDGVGNASNNNIILDPNGSENINGSSTKTMQSDRKSVTIVCSTDQWQIISEFTSG